MAYIEAVGRRKTSVARVRLTETTKQSVIVNDKDLNNFFPVLVHQQTVLAPFTVASIVEKYAVTVLVKGGGVSSQAEAIRHGIARALLKKDATIRKPLKAAGHLKRDPRQKERRKFGLKKARKSPQWSKR